MMIRDIYKKAYHIIDTYFIDDEMDVPNDTSNNFQFQNVVGMPQEGFNFGP